LEESKTEIQEEQRQSYQDSNTRYQESRDKLAEQVKQALEAAKNKYHEERENLRTSIQNLKNYKNEKTGEAQDVYEQTKEQLVKPIHLSQEKYRSAKKQLLKYYNHVYNELLADYEKAKQLSTNAKTQFARDEATKLYNAAKTNLRESYDRMVEFGQVSLETAKDLIDTLKEYSQYYSQKVVDNTKDGLESAKQTVADGIEAAKQTAAEGLAAAQETVSQGVDSAKQTASDSADAAAQSVDSAKQTAAKGVKSTKDKSGYYYDTLEQDYEAAKRKAAEFLERAKVWLTEDDNVHRENLNNAENLNNVPVQDTANPHIHIQHQEL